ncbi:MAG: transposase [Christensenellaceae bacterium]|nr:transposase [Christensenellaceae bacterium]
MKLAFQDIYRYVKNRDKADLSVKRILVYVDRSQKEPIKNFAKTIRKHWCVILCYFKCVFYLY